jgi:hypothetical protein
VPAATAVYWQSERARNSKHGLGDIGLDLLALAVFCCLAFQEPSFKQNAELSVGFF